MYKMRSLVTVMGAVFCAGAVVLIPATARAQECFTVPSDLVSWWQADGNSDDIEDGNSPVQTIGDPAFVTGKVGQAFEFDGNDGYIVPNSANLNFGTTGSFSIDAWIRIDGVSAVGDNALIDKRGAGTPKRGYKISIIGPPFVAPGTSFVSFAVFEGSAARADTALISDNDFHHIAGVVDRTASTISIYLDGVHQETESISGIGDITSNSRVFVGHQSLDGVITNIEPFIGALDELEVFDRPLTASEIQAMFDAGDAGKCKDEDGDGFRPPEDCDEDDPFVNPDAIELPGNFVDENCDGSLGDVDPCFDWKSHGEYIRNVAHAVNDLVAMGILTEEEGDALISSAAMSKIGKKGFIPVECQ